jgi:hypothetical protein
MLRYLEMQQTSQNDTEEEKIQLVRSAPLTPMLRTNRTRHAIMAIVNGHTGYIWKGMLLVAHAWEPELPEKKIL